MINSCSINWFKVIDDLNKFHFDFQTLGHLIGVHKITVKNWKQGTEPRYCDGEKLVFLWCQATGKKRKNIPIKPKKICRVR